MGDFSKKKATLADFEWGNDLGEGAYATVRLARHKETGKEYAVKVLEKKHVIKMDKVKYVASERDIQRKLNHPNIIKLHNTFQDDACLYFVMELASGGELFEQIQKHGPAQLACAQFYAAEIVSALRYLHSQGVVHRDLKPENMLVSEDGHIKLTDFGSATLHGNDVGKGEQEAVQMTFVGTAQYVSPEILNNEAASQSCDLWALGCVIFQLLAGYPPFRGDTDYLIFQKILQREFTYPPNVPDTARDLINKLLVLDPAKRLGAGPGGYDEIQAHPFFKGIDFATLQDQVPPPFRAEQRQEVGASKGSGQYCALASFAREPLQPVEIQAMVEQQSQIIPQWKSFLLPDEAVVLCGMMQKRVGLFARPRLFVLTAFPRLFYINTERKELRGEIPWGEITRLEERDASTLYIHTASRVYYLEGVESPQLWIKAIQFLQNSCQ